jgi:hypothetical protein
MEGVFPEEIKVQPAYCQYATGPCDQSFKDQETRKGLFIYSSEPATIAHTIQAAIHLLAASQSTTQWRSWRELPISGQIIFCEICKALRFSDVVVSDVSTLNFNVLFEMGYALGLGKPIFPIRDTTYVRDRKEFDQLGLLDTVGYVDFQNADTLARELLSRIGSIPIPQRNAAPNKEQPIYVVKSHIDTDGQVRLLSALEKSAFEYRVFDPKEIARLSQHEAYRQVTSSLAVITLLLSPHRIGATVHNARSAFLAGLAMAQGRHLLMLQEDGGAQPIDYRDLIIPYTDPARIPEILVRLLRRVARTVQEIDKLPVSGSARILETVNLGDIAAENEVGMLRSYFVQTSQFNEAKRGNAQLVIGRKGSGKTAIFYGLKEAFSRRRSHLLLDLKPEGHQFTKLREALARLSPGFQQHTLTAFWNYLLMSEIAHKISEDEVSNAYRAPETKNKYERLLRAYASHAPLEQGDFSERLLELVDEIVRKLDKGMVVGKTAEVTELVYRTDIRELAEAIADYISDKDAMWLLVDNLDKSWPVKGATTEDILILRCLLEATHKIRRQLERRGVEFRSIVFLRNDIYEHLLRETPDRGKDTVVSLDWNDIEVFKEMLLRRVEASTTLTGTFEEVWPQLADRHVGVDESFRFIMNHTLMRPRDALRLMRKCLEVAVNRQHDRISEDDIRRALRPYSEDMLQDLDYELHDVYPQFPNLLYEFIGCPARLSEERLSALLGAAGVGDADVGKVIQLLLWFGFLGMCEIGDKESYIYQVGYDLRRLVPPSLQRDGQRRQYVVHPGFRDALEAERA